MMNVEEERKILRKKINKKICIKNGNKSLV